jgi:phage antirepressor YoqD-like protein
LEFEQKTLAQAEVKKLEAQIAANQPKIEYYDESVADNVNTFTIREAAKILGRQESQLRAQLEGMGMIFRNRQGNWEPKADSIRMGLLQLRFERIVGKAISSPAITHKGLDFFPHSQKRRYIQNHQPRSNTSFLLG